MPEPLQRPAAGGGRPAGGSCRRLWHRLRELGPLVAVSLAAWLTIGAAELLEGIAAGSPVEFAKGAVMLFILPPVVAVLRRQQRQHRQAVVELNRTQDRLRDMAAASSDWLWEMGPDLRFTHFGGTIPRVTLEHTQTLIGKTRLEAFDTSLAPQAWAAHADDLARRRPFRDFVYPWKDDDGQLCHCRISGRPFFDDDGTFLGYRGTGSDVTVQIESERALAAAITEQRETDAQFKTLVANIPGAVFRCLTDEQWTDVLVSDEIERLVGYPAHELIGNRVRN
jgi:two-component system, sensor histidine kinase and response regulator